MIVPSITEMLNHVNDQLPSLWRFTTGFCYVLGIGMALKSLTQFKAYADMRLMSAAMAPELKKPLLSLVVAMVLLYTPTLAKISLNTFFNSPSPTAYEADSSFSDDFNLMVQIFGNIVELIGLIAFVRGWILLSHIGHNGSQPGMFGKAMAYICGGICAMNIFGTWDILKGTLGIID